MIISINWLKKFTDIDLPVDKLATLVGARLVEIEETVDLNHKYEGVVVAKVVSCEPLENSDHLNVTKIDDGGSTPVIARDENGFIQVVCGAPNVRQGITVAWLPPGATVPDSFGTGEPFILSVRPLRGFESNGMLASAKELDLFDDHAGILLLDEGLQPGMSFKEAYELNDCLLDIENKSLTHRPDAFGIIGFAREVAAIQGKKFTTPEWLNSEHVDYGVSSGDIDTPNVTIDSSILSSRYQAVVLKYADNSRESPIQIQTYLARVGVRPINAIVDVTNMLMMVTGQPLHAFDYDKLMSIGNGRTDIHVRLAYAGEQLELLDGRTISLDTEDIVIAIGDTVISLAGAMGGASTAIDENTTSIILESATFNLYNLRSTQMRHGIFSEAITRFTKGLPAGLTAPVLAEAIRLLHEWSGAKRVSDVADTYLIHNEKQILNVPVFQINDLLGTSLTAEYITQLLMNVEFEVENKDDNLKIGVPYWRADIHISEDIIEEVGRLYGFDNIKPQLPIRDFTATSPSAYDEFRTRVRSLLVRAGANEVLTYSFVHGDILNKATQVTANSYRITNSISPDLQYYRQSLTPSLLNIVTPNIRQGYDTFAVFEINKSHPKSEGIDDEGVPIELETIAFTVSSKDEVGTASYYQAKRFLNFIMESMHTEISFVSLGQNKLGSLEAPFEPRRSAYIIDQNGILIGIVGEYKKSVTRSFKLSSATSGFELYTTRLFDAFSQLKPEYRSLSKFPGTERDVCFQVERSVSYESIAKTIKRMLNTLDLQTRISPLDIYQPQDGNSKNITIRIHLASDNHTLTSNEANAYIDQVAIGVIEATGAVII